MSKSSGKALDLIMRSRSSLVSRFSFALLSMCQYRGSWSRGSTSGFSSPVLEPNLYLPGAKAGDFASQAFAVSGIGMSLASKLAHEKAGLVMSEPV